MPVPKKLIKFLDSAKIKYPSEAKGGKERMFFDYEIIKHRKVFTAFDKAQTLRVPEKTVGKTLVVKLDKNFALILIPANKNLDKGKLKKFAKARLPAPRTQASGGQVKNIGFVTENWVKKNIKGAKVGAVPPFGNLWKLPTFADKCLFKNQKIIINGGDYTFSIKIKAGDMKKLIPDLVMGNFSKPR